MNLFTIGGRGVNLLLTLLLVLIYLYDEYVEAIAAATVAALLYDVCFGQFVGVSALATLLIGSATVVMKKNFRENDLRIMLIIAAAGTILYNLMFWGIMALGGHACTFGYMMVRQPGYIIFNLIAATLLFFGFRKFVRRRRKGGFFI